MSNGIGRISGPLLKDNIVRDGVDLAFENDLLYLEVNNERIGVKTETPSRTLNIETSVQTIDLIVDNYIDAANVNLNTTSVISTDLDKLYIDSNGEIIAPSIRTENLQFNNNQIYSFTENTDIEIRPTGKTVFGSNLDVTGNIHANADITFDGSIIFGDSDQDTVTLFSDVNSNIVPDNTDTYNLGFSDNVENKRWRNLFVKSANPSLVYADNLIVAEDINYNLRFTNARFVSINGNNSNRGNHQNAPYRNIKYALSVVESGDTVFVFPGEYEEEFPLTVPQGVTVIGFNIRNTIIKPTELTKFNDAFLLNGETTVSDITVKDFYYDSVNNTGYGFRFADNFTVTSRSPYVQNVSVITILPLGTAIQITPGPSPTLFGSTSNSVNVDKTFYSQALVDSLVGQVAVIDRYPNSPLIYNILSIETELFNSNLWRITFDTTFDTSGWLKPISFYSSFPSNAIITNDIWDTTGNSIGEKWVAWFKTNLPADFATTVQPGWTINVAGTLYIVDYIIEDPVNSNQWRIYVTTSLVAGVGIPIFTPPIESSETSPAGRGALVDGSAALSTSKEASMLFHSCTFIVPNTTGLTMKNGVRVEWLNCFTYFANIGLHALNGSEGFADQGMRFGAEIRSIGSANVYGNYGAVADGDATLMYLINHNFGYVGSGLDSSNDKTLTIQENETSELNFGKIYYTSQAQDGDFRIGDAFLVDFDLGEVSFDTLGLALNGVSTIFFQGTTDRTLLESGRIEVGDFSLEANTIKTLTKDFNIQSATQEISFIRNVAVSKNLNVIQNLSVDGNIFLGNQPLDSITINVDFTQDLYPKTTDTYNIGNNSQRWRDLFLKTAHLQDIVVDDNEISTTLSDSDLLLNGNGTGGVRLEQLLFRNSNISSYNNSNIVITPNTDKNLIISGTYGLRIPRTTNSLNLTGDLRFNTSLNQYEGFSSALVTLGGVYSTDKRTSVLAHPTNNTFNFTTNNITNTTLSASTLRTVRFTSEDLVLDNNSLTSTIGNISFIGSSINLGQVNFENGTISVPENLNLELTTINQGYVQFLGDKAVVFPAGPAVNRPQNPIVGNTRFNSEEGYMETWNGTAWVSVSGEGDLADNEYATESTTIWSIVLG